MLDKVSKYTACRAVYQPGRSDRRPGSGTDCVNSRRALLRNGCVLFNSRRSKGVVISDVKNRAKEH